MGIKRGSKLLLRQISAIVIVFIILWLVSRVFYAELHQIPVVSCTVMGERVFVSVAQTLSLILVLIVSGLIVGLKRPLDMIYGEALREKAGLVSAVTGHILSLVVIAVLYVFLRGLVTSLLGLVIGSRIADIAYDLVFIVAGLGVVYAIVRRLTE